jgi:hypothetical protein
MPSMGLFPRNVYSPALFKVVKVVINNPYSPPGYRVGSSSRFDTDHGGLGVFGTLGVDADAVDLSRNRRTVRGYASRYSFIRFQNSFPKDVGFRACLVSNRVRFRGAKFASPTWTHRHLAGYFVGQLRQFFEAFVPKRTVR